ncbi:MAG: hypothetical protein ACI93L_003385 [Cyclobacteriaceae bacterium]|jgi:hypothetical protein
MNRILLFVFPFSLLLNSCDTPAFDTADNISPKSRTIQIPIDCQKFNRSTEWVYCEASSFNLTTNPGSILLNVSLRNQRGTESVCYAELYNLTDKEPVAFSGVESVIDYELHTVSTDDLRRGLDFDMSKELTIRFRNTEENSISYISNNSKLIIYY